MILASDAIRLSSFYYKAVNNNYESSIDDYYVLLITKVEHQVTNSNKYKSVVNAQVFRY